MVGSLVSWRAVCAAPCEGGATPDGFAGFGHSPRDAGWQEYFLKLFHVGMMHKNSHVDENCGKHSPRGRKKKSPLSGRLSTRARRVAGGCLHIVTTTCSFSW
nr:hypothetical protein RVX_2079 [Nitratidesulfovibrio sp. HK-II]